MELDEDNSMDQLIVRIGKTCNFKCIFCNVYDNENTLKKVEGIKDIVRNFHYKFKYSNITKKKIHITISGGEPSIFQKETIFAIRYIKIFLAKRGITPVFDIQTNASNMDFNFAKKLKELGVYLGFVSFHTNNKEIYNKLIGANFDNYFQKSLDGINNMNSAGIIVGFIIVLNKLNYKNFIENINFLLKKFPFINIYNISFFQPHGRAIDNLKTLYIGYEKVEKIYNKGLSLLHKENKEVNSDLLGLPVCYLSLKEFSLEFLSNIDFRKNFSFNLKDKKLINNINDSNKIHTNYCIDCIYNNTCSGVWKEVSDIQKLKPITYFKAFETKYDDNYLFINKDNISIIDSEKEFNLGKRLVFFYLKDIDYKLYSVLVNKLIRTGYYKISTFIEEKFNINILNYGVTNIQIDINYVSLNEIDEIISFSNIHSPQFKVNIDLFISNYEGLIKISSYITKLNYKFLRMYIFTPNKNDLNRYIKFINENDLYRFKGQIFTLNFCNDLLY